MTKIDETSRNITRIPRYNLRSRKKNNAPTNISAGPIDKSLNNSCNNKLNINKSKIPLYIKTNMRENLNRKPNNNDEEIGNKNTIRKKETKANPMLTRQLRNNNRY